MQLPLILERFSSINQGRGVAVDGFYTLVSEDGQNTPIVVTGNKGCSITVNITVNRYMIDYQAIAATIRILFNTRIALPFFCILANCIL